MKLQFLPYETKWAHGETKFFSRGLAVISTESERSIGTNDSPHGSLVVERRGGC